MFNLFFLSSSLLLSLNINIFSSIYLLLLLLFLVPLVSLVSLQLFRLLLSSLVFYTTVSIEEKQDEDIISLSNIYIIKKQWFDCIVFLESVIDKDSNNKNYYYLLGLCYSKMDLHSISKKYYLKALDLSPGSILILSSLLQIYHVLEESKNAIDICRKILLIDNDNKKAKKYLNDLNI